MNILLLGPQRPNIIDIFNKQGDRVITTEQALKPDSMLLNQADFLVSYGYRHILKAPILKNFPNQAINIHISLLPWNRGADPNLWSFLDNTPKGVSIHYIDKGIDTGKILVQQALQFSKYDTLKTSYQKLSQAAQSLLDRHWTDIRDQKISAQPQRAGGSFHLKKDRNQYASLLIQGWDTPVCNLIGKAIPSKDNI